MESKYEKKLLQLYDLVMATKFVSKWANKIDFIRGNLWLNPCKGVGYNMRKEGTIGKLSNYNQKQGMEINVSEISRK